MNEILVELHSAVLGKGLVDAIFQLSQGNSSYSHLFQEWYQGMVQGKSIAEALKCTSFDTNYKDVLFLGITSGRLDFVLEDLISGKSYESVYEKFSLVNDHVVCTPCLENEIEMIRSRARLEGATKVYLSMESDYLMNQQYIGKGSVKVTVNSTRTMFMAITDYFTKMEFERSDENRNMEVIAG